jgi:hypothetical protein
MARSKIIDGTWILMTDTLVRGPVASAMIKKKAHAIGNKLALMKAFCQAGRLFHSRLANK